eukprot:Gb_16211 [translate_table: standard]
MATQENSSSCSSSSSNQPKIGKWVPRRLQQQQHKGRNYSSIPDQVRKSVSTNEIPDILLRGLSLETYTEYFITLLALDDLYAEDVSKRIYDKVTMRTINTKWAVLTVPGLQEKGYSPLLKDYIQVKPSQKKCMPYKGWVNVVKGDKILVKFAIPIDTYQHPNLQYDVRLIIRQRRTEREAIAEAGGVLSKSFLFPSESSIPMRIKKLRESCTVAPFNKSLNQQHLAAVTQILKCCGSPPYIVYGEKGTGTSQTITEAILQIHARNPNARILACTPFNLSSDILMKRLIGSIHRSEMFRLHAAYRPYDEVLPQILPYCLYEDEVFSSPSVRELLEYKVIVSTYMSVERLHTEGVPRGHFTHILLDRAGQASEPETTVALAKLATTNTVVVVAGDPEYRAHHVRSPIAKMYGLEKTFLKRLIELPLYNCQNQCGREKKKMFETKLEKEYDPDSEIWEILY